MMRHENRKTERRKQTESYIDWHTLRQTDRRMERQLSGRKTGRQTDGRMVRQVAGADRRQTYRQIEWQKNYRRTDRHFHILN
jgi:hypothetical protein